MLRMYFFLFIIGSILRFSSERSVRNADNMALAKNPISSSGTSSEVKPQLNETINPLSPILAKGTSAKTSNETIDMLRNSQNSATNTTIESIPNSSRVSKDKPSKPVPVVQIKINFVPKTVNNATQSKSAKSMTNETTPPKAPVVVKINWVQSTTAISKESTVISLPTIPKVNTNPVESVREFAQVSNRLSGEVVPVKNLDSSTIFSRESPINSFLTLLTFNETRVKSVQVTANRTSNQTIPLLSQKGLDPTINVSHETNRNSTPILSKESIVHNSLPTLQNVKTTTRVESGPVSAKEITQLNDEVVAEKNLDSNTIIGEELAINLLPTIVNINKTRVESVQVSAKEIIRPKVPAVAEKNLDSSTVVSKESTINSVPTLPAVNTTRLESIQVSANETSDQTIPVLVTEKPLDSILIVSREINQKLAPILGDANGIDSVKTSGNGASAQQTFTGANEKQPDSTTPVVMKETNIEWTGITSSNSTYVKQHPIDVNNNSSVVRVKRRLKKLEELRIDIE